VLAALVVGLLDVWVGHRMAGQSRLAWQRRHPASTQGDSRGATSPPDRY
jgi:hypothetical protein